AFDNAAGRHRQTHHQRSMIKPDAREGVVAERHEHRHHSLIGHIGSKSTADDRSSLLDVTVKNEATLKRIHRSLDALDSVRHPIVEDHQAIELWLDRRKEPRAGIRLSNVIAEEITFFVDDGL